MQEANARRSKLGKCINYGLKIQLHKEGEISDMRQQTLLHVKTEQLLRACWSSFYQFLQMSEHLPNRWTVQRSACKIWHCASVVLTQTGLAMELNNNNWKFKFMFFFFLTHLETSFNVSVVDLCYKNEITFDKCL